MKKVMMLMAAAVVGIYALPILAGDEEDMAEMQKRLNQEVMDKPFSVEDQSRIDAYMEEAVKKNLKPIERPPENWNWRPGYTCASIYNYGWQAYSQCAYYHRYYGRYW